MRILIVGASGFLGTKLFNLLSKKHVVIGTYFGNKIKELYFLNASSFEDVKRFFLKYKPELVIDTVALTSSLACEQNPGLAGKLNYLTAKNIADVCRLIGAKMVFMSSTYLFDGKKGNYSEKDETKAINVYAKTKIKAEEYIMNKLKNYLILRVDIMYGYNEKGEKNGVFDKILSEDKIEISDPKQTRQPVLVDDIAKVILELTDKKQTGIFHIGGSDRVNMYAFLRSLERIVREDSKIVVVKEDKSGVKRPKNPTMNISKIKKLGIKIHSFKEGVKIIRKQID